MSKSNLISISISNFQEVATSCDKLNGRNNDKIDEKEEESKIYLNKNSKNNKRNSNKEYSTNQNSKKKEEESDTDNSNSKCIKFNHECLINFKNNKINPNKRLFMSTREDYKNDDFDFKKIDNILNDFETKIKNFKNDI